MNTKAIKKEYKRLEGLLDKAGVLEHQKEVLQPVIDNLSWQRVKLEETMELMKDADVVIEYNNGGGQEGIRENPIFKAYISLFRIYLAGLDKFTSYLPKDLQEEEKQSSNVLAQVIDLRSRKGMNDK